MSSPHGRSAPIGGRLRLRLKEIGAFGVVGGIAFVVDIGLFQLLYGHLGVGAVTAKTLATLVSMAVAFLGHRAWSFAHRDTTAVRRSFTLFALINVTTLVLGAAIIWFVRYPLGQESLLVVQTANIISIGINSVFRYLAYRRWVFPAVADPDAAEKPQVPADGAVADDGAVPPAGRDETVPAVTRRVR
ncbi:GtrA family protein [Blastococcus sp. TF02-09]|uniref:GtrA family protein n=1 Tax=Blastococcus sp. TF02-09 TaxID=2250576 RepID=UPI000DE970E9|nr:GtrA family protein [Blastococcus sp. TF02-9]RBY80060.1 GtrA family protein [Blastococcus sp. TF02-9]